MGIEFHLTSYERYRREGLDAHRGGDAERARFCLLKSAEHLYEVSQRSEGELKSSRAERAQELVALARSVTMSGAKRNGVRSLGSAPRAASQPRGVASSDSDSGEGESQVSSAGERFLVAERPDVKFADIAGLDDVKEEVRLKIIYPFLHTELAEKYRLQAGGGILLYGPPGTGKTLIARAIAGETQCAFFTVKPSEILSKWVGEAEQNLEQLFAAARRNAPSIIFIDEIDALAPCRAENRSSVMSRLVPQILAELEGFGGRREPVLFLGATNEPWSLDPAILRPGRFDERIYVGLPDHPALLKLLELQLADRPLAADVDLPRLAELLDGCTGADVRNICRKAADEAFLRAIEDGEARAIDQLCLLRAREESPPSVRAEALQEFFAFRDGRAR
ncbi:MAG: ATP-binding protein [Planctomycetota bacterium]